MACKVYRLRGSTTITTNAVATLQMPRNGKIKAVQWTVQQITSVAACSVTWELGFNSTGQLLVNDPSGTIATVGNGNSSSAAGGAVDSENFFQPCDQAYRAGDKIYLHCLYLTGNETAVVQASLFCEE